MSDAAPRSERPLARRSFLTPVGELTALASDKGLVALVFGPRVDESLGRLHRHGRTVELGHRSSPHIERLSEWMDAYFHKRWRDLPYVPLDLVGTPFERQVWQSLRLIGPGQLTSYGHLADVLPDHTAARAIGQAVGANPVALLVGCHRVLSANGSLTGYRGGLSAKAWLLRHEGSMML